MSTKIDIFSSFIGDFDHIICCGKSNYGQFYGRRCDLCQDEEIILESEKMADGKEDTYLKETPPENLNIVQYMEQKRLSLLLTI